MLGLGPRVGPTLVEMLHTRENADYRGGAAQVLRELKYRDASPALLDALGDRDEYVAEACFRALEEMGIPTSYSARFLIYLESGTKIDAHLAGYFCSHRDPAAAGPLLKALQSNPKRQDSYSNQSALEDLVDALEFQTGAHLGQDPKAWQHFLQQGATTPQARGELLLSLGDSDGCMLLPIEANRTRLAQELVNRPRLTNQILGPRLGAAKLDPGGSAVLLPREGDKLGLLRLPAVAETSLNQSDLGEDALSFSRNREWLLLRSSESMQIVSMLTGISRAQAIPRTGDYASHWEISDDGTTILESGTKTNIFGLGNQTTPTEFTGQERGNPALSPNGQTLALQRQKGVTLVDLNTKKRTELALSDGSQIDDCRFLSNSESLVTWSSAGQLEIWSIQGRRLQSLKGKTGRPWGWAFSKDGFLLGLDGNRFVGWDGTGLVQRETPLQNSLSLQGDHILTSGDDGWLTVTSFSTGKLLWRLPSRQAGEQIRYYAALTPDGQHLATLGAERNLVQLWRLPGSDKADTDVSPELLQLQLQRATGRQFKNDQVVNLTLEEYQQVVQRCIQLETAHRAECKVGR